jgi:hypothetical protein
MEIQQLAALGANLRLLPPLGGSPADGGHQAAPGLNVPADHHVLQHGEVAEKVDVLIGAGDALLGDLIRLQAAEGLSVKGDGAAGELVNAADQVEQRGLAGAVGADQAEDFPLVHGKTHLVDGDQTAEGDGGLFQLQHLAPSFLCASLPRTMSMMPEMPWGR